MSMEFFLTTLIVVIAPGTGVLYTMAVGLSGGGKASIAAAFGCTLGILPSILACLFGIAALLHTSALAFEIVKYLGVAYLLYLAVQTLRDTGNIKLEKGGSGQSYGQIIRKAMLLNFLNPKLTIFFLAFLPQFIPAGAQDASFMIAGLGSVFMLVTLIVFICYGLFAAIIRTQLISRPKILTWIRVGIAATFVGLSAKLALTER